MKTRMYLFVYLQIKYRRPSIDLCIFISKFGHPDDHTDVLKRISYVTDLNRIENVLRYVKKH
jgi:hypothetical protein